MRSLLGAMSIGIVLVACASEPGLPDRYKQGGVVWHSPPEGVVRDAPSAISIARIIWQSMNPGLQGASDEYWQANMDAQLNGDVWEVSQKLPAGAIGGGLNIFVSRKDGRVLGFALTQ